MARKHFFNCIWIYDVLITLSVPLLLARLWWKSRKVPAYKERWLERLGIYSSTPVNAGLDFKADLWIHAVSLGETITAITFMNALKKKQPSLKIIFTTLTPAGSLQISKRLPDYQGTVQHVYVPFDSSVFVKRFLKQFAPQRLIILETELWPNMIVSAQQQGLTINIINARLSEKAHQRYRLIKPLLKPMFQAMQLICAQTESDQTKYLDLGMVPGKILCTGNLKYDVEIPPHLTAKKVALQTWLQRYDWIWAAGSTHAGEEKHIVKAHQQLQTQFKDQKILLILAPRHIDRQLEVADLLKAEKLSFVLRTQCPEEPPPNDTPSVLLIDTLGELMLFYSVAQLAFIGGSLIPIGGHNMLEAAIFGIPVLSGPHVQNFSEIAQNLSSAQGLVMVHEPEALAEQLQKLWLDPALRQKVGAQAKSLVLKNQGAILTTLEHLQL